LDGKKEARGEAFKGKRLAEKVGFKETMGSCARKTRFATQNRG